MYKINVVKRVCSKINMKLKVKKKVKGEVNRDSMFLFDSFLFIHACIVM